MTSTVWLQGCKNAILVGFGVLIAWAALAALVSFVFDQPAFEAIGIAFAVFWVAVLLFFLGSWIYGRSVAGQVLLDCGPHPTRWLFVFQGILWLVLGAGGVFSGGFLGKAFEYAGPVFGISFAAYWLFLGTGRLQVRENGIWQYWGLLRWRKIGAYRWAEDGTLLVKPSSRFALLRGALPVPRECQPDFQKLLTEHCSAQANAVDAGEPGA